ncbi:MAG: response regulator [Desulfobulbaceae bacterium]|jgi:two-component system chemotaxis response regulator CheB|nr:response regulator [Desulfobulbaceae bacterium]
MIPNTQPPGKNVVSILIVDDSLVFRRFLREVCGLSPQLHVIGEGRNGIEALDLILKLKPDVVLMDMEMPVMDGMTALQHLMIHRPTPLLMFSSLSDEGTARAFDALKSGAVDFVCKDFIFREKNLENYKNTILVKLLNCGRMKLGVIDPMYSAQLISSGESQVERHIIFCEDCGEKYVLEIENGQLPQQIQCRHCGDVLDVSAFNKHRRNTFATVIGGGEGCYRSLLAMLPMLEIELGGSFLIVVRDAPSMVDSFAEYLASVSSFQVFRASEGQRMEGGHCYVAAAADMLVLKPFSAHYTLQRALPGEETLTEGLDLAMQSVAKVFKQKSAGVVLSGNEGDGRLGMMAMRQQGASVFALHSQVCFVDELTQAAQQDGEIVVLEDEQALVETIRRLHQGAQTDSAQV